MKLKDLRPVLADDIEEVFINVSTKEEGKEEDVEYSVKLVNKKGARKLLDAIFAQDDLAVFSDSEVQNLYVGKTGFIVQFEATPENLSFLNNVAECSEIEVEKHVYPAQ